MFSLRTDAVTDNFRNKIVNRIKTEIAEEHPELKEKVDAFGAGDLNFYAGISPVYTGGAEVNLTEAKQIADNLYSEALQAGKYVQLSEFSNKLPQTRQAIVEEALKRPDAPGTDKTVNQRLIKIREPLLKESKTAPMSAVATYTPDMQQAIREAKVIGIEDFGFDTLSQGYSGQIPGETEEAFYDAVDFGDIPGAKKIIDSMIASQASYTSSRIPGKQNIFVGNDNYKAFINMVARTRPAENLAIVSRMGPGSDEYGIVVWDAANQDILVYRLDGNNIGAISNVHGRQAGDEIIDRQLTVADLVAQEAIGQTSMDVGAYIQHNLPRVMRQEFDHPDNLTPVEYAIAQPEVVVRMPRRSKVSPQAGAPEIHLVDRVTGDLYEVAFDSQRINSEYADIPVPVIKDAKGRNIQATAIGLKAERVNDYEIKVEARDANILKISSQQYQKIRSQGNFNLSQLTSHTETLPAVTGGFVRIPLKGVPAELIDNRDIAYGQGR